MDERSGRNGEGASGEESLLGPGEPHPVELINPDGRSAFFLTCDHAGRRLPARLGNLGLPDTELVRHIAWDIGIAAVARRVADALDAALVSQIYSRLAIDCNRPPDAPSSVPIVSESTAVPGNHDLSPAERDRRVRDVFRPYHDRIEAELDRRTAAGRSTVLVAMHSFTPVYKGERRPWHVGTLYGRDDRLARPLHAALVRAGDLVVGDNEPYAVSDETDYTIPVHAERRGLLHVGIEVRQDLIEFEDGQARWAELLSRTLIDAARAATAPVDTPTATT